MAVYGRDDPGLFERALGSVFSSTIAPEQVVLVVDGPLPPELDRVIDGFAATCPALEVCRLATNRGLANALNQGLRVVRRPWTVRADADDINLPERFAVLAAASQSMTQPTVFGSAILEVEREGKQLSIRRPPLTHAEIARQMPLRNPFNHMAVAFRTQAIREAGGYPDVHLREDYALWCTLSRGGSQFLNVPQVLVHATTGPEMYARRGGWKYIRAEIDMQVLMVRLGLKTWLQAGLHGLARCAVFALPGWARGIVYRRMLRTSIEEG